jgi:hypothetical protein
MPAEVFVRQMQQILAQSNTEPDIQEKTLSDEEIDDWLELFGGDQENGG